LKFDIRQKLDIRHSKLDISMRPLSHALPGALALLLRETPLSDGKVTFAWRAAVGAALERVTAVKLQGRVLIVEAGSSQWAREIERSKSLILSRLQSLLGSGVVTHLEVRSVNIGLGVRGSAGAQASRVDQENES
jgi:predicted nucleic acid-binding Zn ribbon protein